MFCAYMQACCLCDGYAATFLLDKVDAYASAENVPTEKVRQKREIGIYFALFAMTLIGARHWRSSERTGCNLSKEYGDTPCPRSGSRRSEEHTSELQSLMRTSYAVFCLKKKKTRS